MLRQGPGKTIVVQDARMTIDMLKEQARFTANQIAEATGRREDLVDAVRRAAPDRQQVMQQQLRALDQQLVELEKLSARLNAQIMQSIPAAVGLEALPQGETSLLTPLPPPPSNGWGGFGLPEQGFFLLVIPIVVLAAWRFARRGASRMISRGEWNETAQRLQRIEIAVDAIALEVERVSEAQRFLARTIGDDIKTLKPAGSLEAARHD